MRRFCTFALLLSSACFAAAPPAAATADPLGRGNPQSTVTAFLEACHANDYAKAAQYLDLTRIPAKTRTQQSVQLAKDLESILNSASRFNVVQLSHDAQGNLEDDTDPAIEHVAEVSNNGRKYTLELQRSQPSTGPAFWVFSASTVALLPEIAPVPNAESAIEARLPRFLVSVQLLETPLWKWISLLLLAIVLFAIFRLLLSLLAAILAGFNQRFNRTSNWAWLQATLDPILVLFVVILFGIGDSIIRPAALTRLYIGRFLLMIVVSSFAWGLIMLVDYLIQRLDRTLNQQQRVVSHSVIYLGRRTVKALIAIFAAILILDNWGFNMTTIIAGLGVGGIAVALAAQQTIANVFGGVSVIGDSPVMIGDFGNFGGVVGTIEDIGLRSARVRTLTRTVVSVPNSSFAGMNLENFSVRDKILFNPTFTIKRSTPKDQIRKLMQALHQALGQANSVEIGPSPVRISGYAAASFTIELFAYVQTVDIDEFYKHQAELYLTIDDVITSSGVELA